MENLQIEELNRLMFKKEKKNTYFFRDKKLNTFCIEKFKSGFFLVRINGAKLPYDVTFDKAIACFKSIFIQ